jgi:hypothetical protein
MVLCFFVVGHLPLPASQKIYASNPLILRRPILKVHSRGANLKVIKIKKYRINNVIFFNTILYLSSKFIRLSILLHKVDYLKAIFTKLRKIFVT